MRVLAKSTLRTLWSSRPRYADAEEPLSAWHTVCRRAEWQSPADVKAAFRSASFVRNNVVFNIAGNKYRVVVSINYRRQAMYVKFVGTHEQYNAVNVGEL